MRITKGNILKEYRTQAGISQAKLSEITGIKRGTIDAQERRNSNIQRKYAKLYDKALNVKKSWLERLVDAL